MKFNFVITDLEDKIKMEWVINVKQKLCLITDGLQTAFISTIYQKHLTYVW